jgi:type I restriction enzyme S subunit
MLSMGLTEPDADFPMLSEECLMSDSDWSVTTLGDVAEIIIGRTPPRGEKRFWTEDLERPFCTISDMRGWHVRPEREGVTEAAEREGKARRIPRGALLMSFKLTLGKIGFAAQDLFPNEAIAWIKPLDSAATDPTFLAYWLANSDFTRYSGRASKGRTMNKSSLQQIEVVVPPPSAQAEVVRLMESVDAVLAEIGEVERAARSTRASLLRSVLAQDLNLGPAERA